MLENSFLSLFFTWKPVFRMDVDVTLLSTAVVNQSMQVTNLVLSVQEFVWWKCSGGAMERQLLFEVTPQPLVHDSHCH